MKVIRQSSEHPSDEELEHFAAGRMTEQASQDLADHISVCDRCTERIEVVAVEGDVFLQQIQRAAKNPDPRSSGNPSTHSHSSAVGNPKAVSQLGKSSPLKENDRSNLTTTAFGASNGHLSSPDTTLTLPDGGVLPVEKLLDRLVADQRRRWNTKQRMEAGEYLAQYPAIASAPDLAAQLIFQECALRKEEGGSADLAEYLTQFPQYASELRNWKRIDEIWRETERSAASLSGVEAPGGTFAHYDLTRQIAHGGMGVVYKAWDQKLQRVVALKLILAGPSATDAAIERFDAEARAAAKLDHPGIVPVHEFGECDGRHYIAMAYVEGQNLAELVARQPLPPREAAELTTQVALAMAYAHKRGVVHRDLKPANILLDSSGTPRVTDFGLAKLLDADTGMTATGQLLGTPSYMSPEQARGLHDQIGPSTDVYAFGAILYCLLTGRPPFQAAEIVDTLQQVIEQDAVSLCKLNPLIPSDLETICLKCLRKEPHLRYASATALAEDLQRFLNGQPILGRKVSAFEKTWRWCRRHPARAGLMLVSAIAFAGIVSTYVYVQRLDAERTIHEVQLLAEKEQAAIQEYYHRIFAAKDKILNRSERWPRIALEDVTKAAALDTDVRDAVQLRTLAASCIAGVALEQRVVIENEMDPHCLKFSPNGELLAIGAVHGQVGFSVELWDVEEESLRATFFLSRKLSLAKAGCASLAFSPDGEYLVVGGRDGRIAACRTSDSSQPLNVWQAHDGPVTVLVFSESGQHLISGADDGLVKSWEFEQATLVNSINVESQVLCMALTHGSQLFFSSGVGVRQVDIGELCTDGATPDMKTVGGYPHTICVSTGGRMFAFEEDDKIRIREQGLNTVHLLKDPSLGEAAHDGEIAQLRFNPDSSLLLSASGDQTLKIWEVASGQLLSVTHLEEGNPFPEFSPDGRIIATTGDHVTTLYDVVGLKEQTFVAQNTVEIQTMEFGPGKQDGDQVLAIVDGTGAEKAPVRVSLWDMELNRWVLSEPAVLPHPPPARSVPVALACSPVSGQFALTNGGRAYLWDTEKFEELPVQAELVRDVAFSVDGRRVWATADGKLVSWRPGDKSVVDWWNNFLEDLFSGRSHMKTTAVGPAWLVVGSNDGSVRIMSTETRLTPESANKLQMNGTASSVALTHDESLAAAGMSRGMLRVFRVPSGEPLGDDVAAHDANIRCLAFRPHDPSLLVTGSDDGFVRFWQVSESGPKLLLSLEPPSHYRPPVRHLTFSQDGNTLAVLLRSETAVRLWHLDRLRSRLRAVGLDW